MNRSKGKLAYVVFVALGLVSFLPLSLGAPQAVVGQVGWTFIYLPALMVPAGPAATPTRAPSPTATPKPEVVVLPNYWDFTDKYGYLHVLGEIQNNTNTHIWWPKVFADFFNSSGQLIATDYDYVFLDDLPAHEKTCFHIELASPTGWSTYTFEKPAYSTWASGHAFPNLTAVGINPMYDSETGYYQLLGQVRNDEIRTVSNVQVNVTLYDISNKVIGCEGTTPNNSTLSPGQLSAFSLGFGYRDYADVTTYRIQLDGDPQ